MDRVDGDGDGDEGMCFPIGVVGSSSVMGGWYLITITYTLHTTVTVREY